MLALSIASRHILNQTPLSPRREINIFSDSIAALKNITDPGPHPAQAFSLIFIRNITEALERYPDLKVTLDWCPGHSQVIGNEISDALANEARPLRGVLRHATSTFLKTKHHHQSMRRWKRSHRFHRLSHDEKFPYSRTSMFF